MNPVLWQPSAQQIKSAQITTFINQVNQNYKLELNDYEALYNWSVEKPEDFWESLAVFCEVKFHQAAETILQATQEILGSHWFEGATLNYAEHCLRHRGEHTAIEFHTEAGLQRSLSYEELYMSVAQCQAELKSLGVEAGDRVAAVLPNMPETIIAMLATTSLGAIWSSCSPDFGAQGIVERFSQIEPKVLFACADYLFKGKQIDCRDKIRAVEKSIPSIIKTIETPFKPNNASTVEFTPVPFEHPGFILYSSGTTGKPKCIVHGHGGTLLQHLKELVLHTDLKREDKLMYVTTCGWMMWNWMASGLAVGATLVLYEGSPIYPKTNSLLGLVKDADVTVFGTSARYLQCLEQAAVKTSALPALRTILSTGSPLAPETFAYVYKNIKADLCLSSISGGTDIISCFALGCPILPVHAGELQCRGLGMAVAVFNAQGEPVIEQQGELVCTKPFPSMPICFWNDPDNKKYRQAYFSQFKNSWAHADYAMLTHCSGIMIFGRSDAVLNPGGIRIGTAEIYQPVESLPQIKESLAVGHRLNGDERVVLFVVLKPDCVLDETLKREIKAIIKAQASPRHVPAEIFQVNDLPRTVNGKLSELAVKHVIHGEPISNTYALQNPACLNEFKGLLDKS